MTCVNCGSEISENYCSKCGQRANVKRITLKEGWIDFWARIYGFDGMFPRTLRDLTIRPGTVSREFIKGNRTKYYGPVGYFFFIITLIFLVASLLGLDFTEFMMSKSMEMSTTGANQTEKQSIIQKRFVSLVVDNFKIFIFALIPFQVWWAKRFFRKSGYNFMETSVLFLFTQGHLFWLTILSLLGMAAMNVRIPMVVSLTIQLGYVGFAVMTFYNYNSKPKAFFKGVVLYLLALLSFVITLALLTGLYIYLNPDILQSDLKGG